MGAAEGIVAAIDVTKLRQHDGHYYGGHINITKNWDQTGLSVIPTRNWTMHKAGAKVVPIAHSDD